MRKYDCYVRVEVQFPIEVYADDEYEAEDIAREELMELINNPTRLKSEVSKSIDLYVTNPVNYYVFHCERSEE